MKPRLNKWGLELHLYKRPEYLENRRTFIFGIYKLTSRPKEGVRVSKENYKGFRFVLTFLVYRGF